MNNTTVGNSLGVNVTDTLILMILPNPDVVQAY